MVNSGDVPIVMDDLASDDDQSICSDIDDPCLFINDTGEPLSFILNMRSFDAAKKYTKMITKSVFLTYGTDLRVLLKIAVSVQMKHPKDRFGIVKKLKDFGDYDAVLVPDACAVWGHSGDVFKVSYIDDCIEKGILLNITNYRYNSNSKLCDDFNYMDILYRRRYSWNSIPEKYLIKKPVPVQLPSRSLEDRLLDENSDNESVSFRSDRFSDISSNAGKRTKALFNETERKAIVNYIFKKKQFDMLKGNVFWKKMEAANICPIRTWQSLKNHFSKTLAYDLPAYDLPQEDMIEFKRHYFLKKR